MEDSFSSQESDEKSEDLNDIVEQKKVLKKLQNQCLKYESDIQKLEKEKKDREAFLQTTLRDIEELQRNILYYDLNIEKSANVYSELNDLNKDNTKIDKIEQRNEMQRVDNEISRNLTKYVNRVMYTKKHEFDEKSERKKNAFQAVCIKYYREDPTDEDFGQQHLQGYTFQVFGLSNDLTFEELIKLAKVHWNIERIQDYVLTDQDHHDLILLNNIPVVQYLAHENAGHALFVLRPKNTKMRELMGPQRQSIMLVQETEKQVKLKDEFQKIFKLLRTARPGIKSYEIHYEDKEITGSPGDGKILNFIILVAILVLMIVSLAQGGIQPYDARELNTFWANFTPPSFYASSDQFMTNFIYQLYDYNSNANVPFSLHYVPIGVRRIIMNKMLKQSVCSKYNNTEFCSYGDAFTTKNLDTSNLTYNATNASKGPWQQYTKVPEDQQINIDGQSSFFDGSGFIYDYPVDKTKDQAKKLISDVLGISTQGAYFSEAARAYIFTSMYYEPNRRFILERATLFEIMSSGVVEITDRKTYLKPVSGSTSSDIHFNIDLALLVITIVGYLLNMAYNLWRVRKLSEVYALRNLMKYTIMALVISYFATYYKRPSQSIDFIINNPNFQTFYTYGQLRQNAVTCLIVAFFLQSITLIRSFSFSRTLNLFLNIFAHSYKDFLAFLLLFFSTFVGFSFVWWITFGPYTQNLQNLVSTAFEIFLYFATGNTLIINLLFTINEVWAVILVILTCFIIFIQLDALMMSVIQENVRSLYMRTKPTKEQTALREAINTITIKGKAFLAKVQGFGQRFRKNKDSVTRKKLRN